MAIGFPGSPFNKKQFSVDSKLYEYNSTLGAWSKSVRAPVSPGTATITDISNLVDGSNLLNNPGSTIPSYALEEDIWTLNVQEGQLVYVTDTDCIYVYNGSGWYRTSTSIEYVPPPPIIMYGDRGLFAGGNTPSASNAVEYIDITTASDAATFGTLSTGIAHGGTASNGTIGIFYGINANTAASNRDYFTIPSNPGAVTASEAGALSTGRKEPGSAGDGTYGTFAGSVPTSSNSNTTLDSIEYITIATTSAGATFANLSATTGSLAGASDGTNAYYFGGYNYNLTSNWDNKRIETLVIATQGQQSSFGNLANDRYNHSAAGNETYGVIAGGGPGGTQTPNSTIERIAYATQTTATSFGSLNGGGRWKNGSLNNETYAIFAGGYTLGPDTYYGTMNFVTIDGAGGSSAFGNLGTNRGDGVRGLSGSPA